jgi:hypothetical protein
MEKKKKKKKNEPEAEPGNLNQVGKMGAQCCFCFNHFLLPATTHVVRPSCPALSPAFHLIFRALEVSIRPTHSAWTAGN